MPKLTVSLPDGASVTHDLNETIVTVGRVPDNSLHIDNASVSSRHATLTLVDGDYVLRDIGSTNGTRVNGQALAPETDQRLQDGDRVRFGQIEAVYASENPAEAQPMPAEAQIGLQPAESSARPANFSNASPFQKKRVQKDPAGRAVMWLAILAMLVFAGAAASVLTLKPPPLPL
ncbi:MAG: FHA domain-containing protein [Verrucomicrobiota bacterium]|nr:FHA domain-containing protein [Verrucomicrobiota bacterium]